MTSTVEKKGSLTIAGSGIASIRHITLETLSYIETSDKVYYALTDPATEAFVLDKSKGDCVDLSIYYNKEKNRYESYVMLRDVQAGYQVLGIFYGHPGVFVSPSHRAIGIARDEGYRVNMLPGISAEDYMFADLGFDPAVRGCMTQEATSLLIYRRKLDPSIHNIIWQVGAIGVANMTFEGHQFHLLVDRLEEDFGPDHKVVHYVGAVLPQDTTIMTVHSVSDLRKEEVSKQISAVSMFYVPPRDTPYPSAELVMETLGQHSIKFETARCIAPPLRCSPTQSYSETAYGPFERAAVDRLQTHTTPSDKKILRASPAVSEFMKRLALQPNFLDDYKADPGVVLSNFPGLSVIEKFALSFDQAGPIHSLMRATASAIASGQEPTVDEISASTGPDMYIVYIYVAVIVITL